MTSPHIRIGARWILGALAGYIGSAGAAEPRIAPRAAEPPPALLADASDGDDEFDEIDRAARVGGQSRRVLRCWQEGRLIVERPVRSVPPESLRAVPLGGEGRAVMQLYDLRNSTCLIE